MIPNALVMRKEGRRKLTEETCNAKRNTVINSSRLKNVLRKKKRAKKKATGNTN